MSRLDSCWTQFKPRLWKGSVKTVNKPSKSGESPMKTRRVFPFCAVLFGPGHENATKLQKMLQFFLEKGRFPIDNLVIIGV